MQNWNCYQKIEDFYVNLQSLISENTTYILIHISHNFAFSNFLLLHAQVVNNDFFRLAESD